MESQENKVKDTSPIATQDGTKTTNEPPQAETEQNPEKSNDNTNLSDEEDVDLSAVQIVSSILDQTHDLDLDLPEDNKMTEGYQNSIRLCNSATDDIKKSINDILNSGRGGTDLPEDPAVRLQESLDRKMRDFNDVIMGCLNNEASASSSGVVIEEVTEEESRVEELKSEEVRPEDGGSKGAKKGCLNDNAAEVKVAAKNVNEKVEAQDSTLAVSKSSTQTVPEAQLSDQELLKQIISQTEEKFTKKQKNGTSKKKGEKTMDQILKSLGNGSAEEKLQILCKKHAETLDEYRLCEPRLKQYERQIISQQREKESTQAELNRMILAKSRLEGLCREMQKQNKSVKEESLLRIKEEEEKRKEIANKFQSTLNDIGALMQENSKKNATLREENTDLAMKLKGLVDNYEIWEQNMNKIVQQKELETQLAKAKHAKVNLVLKQETEKFLKEKQSLLENLAELQKRCNVLTTNELHLRTELIEYTSKYEEFQSVLTNSSKVFSTFKTDMESTSKKIKKLEKETNVYKQKWEGSNKALLDMISHKEKQDKEFSSAQQKIQRLEKLCRALQAERNELQNQINVISSNSGPATNPDVPSSPNKTEPV